MKLVSSQYFYKHIKIKLAVECHSIQNEEISFDTYLHRLNKMQFPVSPIPDMTFRDMESRTFIPA